MTVQINAYTDESGHTGANLFDAAQPWFWTGTLLSAADLDGVGLEAFEEWSALAGTPNLHARVLGRDLIERVAAAIQAFLTKHQCRFIFTRIEKRTVASLKLVDTIIDSGNNPAVSSFHYGVRYFRMSLAAIIIRNCSPMTQEEFWKCYATGDTEMFRRLLRRVHWNILNKTHEQRLKRLRDLALEAIEWAIHHPDEFPELRLKRSDLDSPNLIAVTLICGALHRECEVMECTVGRFIHDEQSQFAASLKQFYEAAKHIKEVPSPIGRAWQWAADLDFTKGWDANLQFVRSKNSVGLKVVDIVLWLVRQGMERGGGLAPASHALFEWGVQNGVIVESSREQVEQDVAAMSREIDSRAVSPADLARGRDVVGRVEAARKARMMETP